SSIASLLPCRPSLSMVSDTDGLASTAASASVGESSAAFFSGKMADASTCPPGPSSSLHLLRRRDTRDDDLLAASLAALLWPSSSRCLLRKLFGSPTGGSVPGGNRGNPSPSSSSDVVFI